MKQRIKRQLIHDEFKVALGQGRAEHDATCSKSQPTRSAALRRDLLASRSGASTAPALRTACSAATGEWTVLLLAVVLLAALAVRFMPEVKACFGGALIEPMREVVAVYEGAGEYADIEQGTAAVAGCYLGVLDEEIAKVALGQGRAEHDAPCLQGAADAPERAALRRDLLVQVAAVQAPLHTPVLRNGLAMTGESEAVLAREPYALSAAEREAVELAVMSEAGCESAAGQRLVAECILNAAEHDGVGVLEVLEKYQYALRSDISATKEVKDAVAAVFDRGERVTDEPVMFFYNPELTSSRWHETLCYVLTEGRHRFFKLWS